MPSARTNEPNWTKIWIETAGSRRYRSSMYITDFLQDLGTEYQCDGSTCHSPEMFCRLIDQLMSPADQLNEGPRALAQVNDVLGREGFEAFYGEENQRYLRHVSTPTVTILAANPYRHFSKAQLERWQLLAA